MRVDSLDKTWRNRVLINARKHFMKLSKRLAVAVAAALALLAGLAQAQYVWVDEHGRKQLSDRPPPTSVPSKNILKQPGGVPQLQDAEPAAAAAAPSSSAASGPLSLADRDADYKKRQLEKADKDAKAADEAKQKLAKRKNCEIARAYMSQLASGERIGVVGNNGERAFMNDAERARRTAETNRVLKDCR